MTIRKEVAQLVARGPLPESMAAEETALDEWVEHAEAIVRPITEEEATALIELFGPDDCFGVAWALLHLIETAPQLPRVSAILLERSEFLRTCWRGPREGHAG